MSAPPSSASSAAPQPSSSSSSAYSTAPTPRVHSLAAAHKLKKDIHRCHRMSRRPLPRPDPMANPFSSRPPISPFSETVRILNRRVKPREVKRGRIILNLKVIDKSESSRRTPQMYGGRAKIPSRNRIIRKRHGDLPYRPFQHPMKMLGFPMYGQPFGLHPDGSLSSTANEVSDTRSNRVGGSQSKFQYQPPPSLSSSSRSNGSSPSLSQKQPQPETSSPTKASSQAYASSSPPSEDEDQGSLNPPMSRGGKRNLRRRPQAPRASSSQVSDRTTASLPEEIRPPKEGDPDWRPEVAPSRANVVVTDVTTNLLTVTIKEFCHSGEGSESPTSPTSAVP